jgi:hypothetical protein
VRRLLTAKSAKKSGEFAQRIGLKKFVRRKFVKTKDRRDAVPADVVTD